MTTHRNKFEIIRNSYLVLLLLFATGFTAAAQKASFGLLKYSVPASWQEQSRPEKKAYFGTATDANIPVELTVYAPQPAATKPDSSFRIAWRQMIDKDGLPEIPYARKTYNSQGIRVAASIAKSIPVQVKDKTRYAQLLVFILNGQMQAVEILTDNDNDYRTLRPFLEEFIENTDPGVKLEE